MRTQRMSELIMIISIEIKVERTIIKGGGFGSEVSGSLIKKKALLAPQVSDKTDTTILMIWFDDIFPDDELSNSLKHSMSIEESKIFLCHKALKR